MTKPNRFGAAVAKRTGPKPTPGSVGEVERKYTVKLTATVADAFDEDMLTVQRKLGRKVDKSEVVRVLLGMLHEDAALLDEVTLHVRDRDGMTA